MLTKTEVLRTLRTLRDDYKVKFVVIGGAGFTLYSGIAAKDIDVVVTDWGQLREQADEVSLFSDEDKVPSDSNFGAATAIINGVGVDFLEPKKFDLKDVVLIRGFKVLSKAQLIATMKSNDPDKVKKLRSLIRLASMPAVDQPTVFNQESIVILKKIIEYKGATYILGSTPTVVNQKTIPAKASIDPKVLSDLEMYLEHNYNLPTRTVKELRRLLSSGEAEEFIHEPTVKWAFHGMTATKSWLKSVGIELKPNLAELRADFVFGNIPSAWTTSEKLASRHFTVRSDFDNNKVDVILVAKTDGVNAATFISGPNGFYKLVGRRQSNEQELLAIEPVKVSKVVVPGVIASLKVTRLEMPVAAHSQNGEKKMKLEVIYRGARYQKVSKIVASTGETFVSARSKSGKTMWKPQVSPQMIKTASADDEIASDSAPSYAEKQGNKGIGDKSQELVQYVDQGNLMSPAGKIVLAPKLKAGVYQITRTMQGLAFERQSIATDKLLRFEDPVHTEILAEMDNFWAKREKFEKKGLVHNRAVLMYGPPGSGKSCIIKIATADLVEQGDIVIIADRYISDLVDGLKILREIEPDRRCLAIMEDVDELGEHSLLQLLDGANTANNVLYLATTNYVDRLPPRVLRAGRFGRKIEVPYPPESGRKAYFESKLSDEEITPEEMKDLVEKTSGLSFGSLKELVTAVYCLGQPLEKTLKRLRGSGLEPNKSPKSYEE